MTHRTLSLKDCRTVAEAETRLRAWLEEIHRERFREVETQVLLEGDDDDTIIDVDLLDLALDGEALNASMHINATVAWFKHLLRGPWALEP